MHCTEQPATADPSDDVAHRDARFADRYDVVKTFKQGNGVSTYLAVDCTTADHVVLKTFDRATVQEGTQARFVHETRVLRELSGIGLCALHDAGQTETHLYLAQQYAPGLTLERALQHGPLPVLAALQTGIAIATALDLAHGAGVCHRDVKPANVIVDGRGPDGSFEAVTLVDFGFARSPWLDDSIRDDLVGTARYLSPEAAGLLSSSADERSDLYAMGVVLYECLVGRPLFDGPSVGDLLRQHLSTPVPDLRSASQAIPRALAAVVKRLLLKDPAERYQSAAAVGADLRELLAAVAAGDPDPRLVIGRHDNRLTLTDPAFVGREVELASLTALTRGLRRAARGVILVGADSGGGKSRLLTEVGGRAADAGVLVLRGQGLALGGQRPFTLLDGVADSLVRLFETDPLGREELMSRLEDVAPAIVRALPALTGLLGVTPDHDTAPEQFGELRSLSGLRRLLAMVASAQRPILMILDDCQWADALTVRLLSELFDDPDDAPRHLAVIAAFRTEEVAADHPLRAIHKARSIHLGPLSPDAVALLAESMAGPLPAEAVDTVVRLADGSPFMAAAVLRGLVESDALVADPEGWRLDPVKLPDVQAARRSAAFLVQRLELLGEDALRLLGVGAVLGKQFDIRTAARIAGLRGPAAASAILQDARRRRLVWLDQAGDTCTFFHDKIRESLLARLPGAVRRDLHSQAANALTARVDPTGADAVFDLAYHLHAAGRRADALPYALAAATLARSRYALDVAVAHYRMAAEDLDPSDTGAGLRIAEGLGDVLMLQGVYGEAEAQLTAARALVAQPAQAAALDGKLGALAFKQGDIATAKDRLEGALTLLGRRIPRRAALVPALMWELLVQGLHSVLPRLTTGRRAVNRHNDFLAMRLYSRLAYLYWFRSGKVSCAWAHLRGMNLAERYGPSAELGQAWSEHAPVMTMLPWYRRGVRYAERSLDIRRQLGDVWGQGQSLNFTGVARYAASDFAGAQAACDQAVRLLRRTGDQWEVNTASWNLALCLLRQGELARTVDVARATFETATAIGDQTAAGIALSVWARATEGRVPAGSVRALLDQGSEDAQTTAELHLADALVHRASGDLEGAAGCLERAVQTVRAAGLRQEYIVPIFPWHATVLRELAEATSPHAPRLRAQRLRRAAKAVRRARRWARFYRNNAPHADREAALVASLRGRRRRAVRRFESSRRIAQRDGARYEQARTALARAEFDAAAGGPAAPTVVADARAALLAFAPPVEPADEVEAQRPATLSIFDRFATLLQVGHSIGAATTAAALGDAVRAAAAALLRAEHGQLVPVTDVHDAATTIRSDDRVAGLSRTLLLESLAAGRPVATLAELNPADSLVLSGVRSALAAPIVVHGETHSLLYVTHRHLGELFGAEEIQLAAFIATLAGAAYEHLASSETRLRSLAKSSSDVISLIGADDVVTYQSPAVERVFGVPATGLVGRPITSWVHPDDVEQFRAGLLTAVAGASARIECRLRHADGSFRFSETVVTNQLGEPTVAALVLNTRDITERKLAADRLHLVEERERIARDLHDVVIQRLFAVGLQLDSMSARLPTNEARHVIAATDELHYTIRDIRGTIFSLRSDEPGRPLSERLGAVLARAEQMLGFAPDVHVDPSLDDAVPESVHLHLLATVNEALSNAARHAGATEVHVRVAIFDGHLVAVVADNGRGLPVEREESGLVNLRHRATLAGGTMTVAPRTGGTGLVLTWRVPLPGAGPEATAGPA